MLIGIKSRLMHPDLVKEFIAEYYRELNRLGATRDGERQEAERGLAKSEREIREVIDAIKSGIRSPTLSAELEALEQRKSALEKDLATEPPPPCGSTPNWQRSIGGKFRTCAMRSIKTTRGPTPPQFSVA
ncbi:MAG: hypothetical protein ACYSVY_22390 [Planctomycetota bacterium]